MYGVRSGRFIGNYSTIAARPAVFPAGPPGPAGDRGGRWTAGRAGSDPAGADVGSVWQADRGNGGGRARHREDPAAACRVRGRLCSGLHHDRRGRRRGDPRPLPARTIHRRLAPGRLGGCRDACGGGRRTEPGRSLRQRRSRPGQPLPRQEAASDPRPGRHGHPDARRPTSCCPADRRSPMG